MRTRVLIVLGIGSVLALADVAVAQQPGAVEHRSPIMDRRSRTSRPRWLRGRRSARRRRTTGAWRSRSSGRRASSSISRRWTAPSSPRSRSPMRKARTAVMFRCPSKAFADQYAAGNTVFMTFPEKPVASEGGVPIVVNGRSSARSAQAAAPASRTVPRRPRAPTRCGDRCHALWTPVARGRCLLHWNCWHCFAH